MKTYRVQVPIVLDLEVLSGVEPAAIQESIKKRFAGVADPLCGTQVFFGKGYSVGHMMARTRNATFIPDGDVKVTIADEVALWREVTWGGREALVISKRGPAGAPVRESGPGAQHVRTAPSRTFSRPARLKQKISCESSETVAPVTAFAQCF